MATLLAHITVLPGQELAFERISAELYRRTHADEADPWRYEYWRGAEPRTYYCLESFADYYGFLAHETSPHHEVASAQYGPVFETIRLEWVDPMASASPLNPTDYQPLPADASDLERYYHERMAAVAQDWWIALREAERQ
jgi:quinol monooxygenase YgiN